MIRLPRPLSLVPRDSTAEEGEVPATPGPAAPAALVPLSGRRMSVREQSAAAVTHAFRTGWRRARDLARREGGLVHGLLAARPPSVLEHFQYGTSRAWVPPGHDGGLAERLGVLYNRTIGAALVLAGEVLIGTGHKPLRFFLALFTILAAVTAIWLA